MAYRMTMLPFLCFAVVALVFSGFSRWHKGHGLVSARTFVAVLFSAVGFVVAPVLARRADVIPEVMLAPEYFLKEFIGCIAPSACLMLYLATGLGVCAGFGIGYGIGCWKWKA